MTFKRAENPDGTWFEEYTGPELSALLDEQPVAECSVCHRKTWETGMIGQTCCMPQPDGGSCPGVLAPLTHGNEER